jgi:hypothetical protein
MGLFSVLASLLENVPIVGDIVSGVRAADKDGFLSRFGERVSTNFVLASGKEREKERSRFSPPATPEAILGKVKTEISLGRQRSASFPGSSNPEIAALLNPDFITALLEISKKNGEILTYPVPIPEKAKERTIIIKLA